MTNKMHFNIVWYIHDILAYVFRPVFRHIHGEVLITRIQLWLNVSPSLRNGWNYVVNNFNSHDF